MQHKIADRVHSKKVHQGIGVKDVSLGLAHLPVALEKPRMAEYLLGKRQTQRHQENGPVNRMEADNILSDQMEIRGPVFFKLGIAFSVTVVADSRNIVGQSVQPNIGHMLGIKFHRDPPGKGSPGNTQILQSGKQEIVHHLIFPGYRLDKLRMLVNIIDQLLRILAHTEKVCFLLGGLYRPSAVRALSVHHLGRRPEGFTGRAVKALVVSFVNISLIIKLFENFLDLLFMVGIGGPDKLVVRRIHQIPDPADLSGNLIHEFLGRHPGVLRL